jgi:hypothetical protein
MTIGVAPLRRRRLVPPLLAIVVASCMSTPPAACLSAARDDQGTVAAFFASTVGAIRKLPIASASQNLAAHVDGEPASLCYIDGAIPKGPPPPASGTIPPSFDRAVLVVVGQDAITVAAGYRQNLPIQAP